MMTFVSCRRFADSERARLLAERMTHRLQRYFHELRRVVCRVAAEVPEGVRVSVHVSAASGLYDAEASGPTVTDAFQAAADRIARQRRRRKQMRLGCRRKAITLGAPRRLRGN